MVDPKLRPSQKKNLANTKFQAKKLLETWVENHEITEVEIWTQENSFANPDVESSAFYHFLCELVDSA